MCNATTKTRAAILVLLVLFSYDSVASGQNRQPNRREQRLKAAWVHNLGKFGTWPAGAPKKDFVITIVGKHPFGAAKNIMKAKRIAGKQVVIHTVANPQNYKAAHIVFVGSSNNSTVQQNVAAIAAATKGKPVLVVTDSPGMGRQGAVVNFVVNQQGLINLEINRTALRNSKIGLDARLLGLSIVRLIP